jgi:hypothetical protein
MTILAAALVPLLDAGETDAMSTTGRAAAFGYANRVPLSVG